VKDRKLKYLLLDVFTSKPLSGNPLAVVCNGDGLLDGEMQAIAREFNLSETVFITSPQSERNTAAVRIFTPESELPFAGHPTVGAAIVLGLQEKAPVIRIEERVGSITALIEKDEHGVATARFGLPLLPEPAGNPPDKAQIALTLGILPEDIGCGLYRPAVYTAGVLFYLIPVRDAQVLANLRLERRGWSDVYPLARHSIYVFTETPNEPGVHFAARMFTPGMPGGEDPGTGSAAAALIGLLSEHASFSDGQGDYVLRQGDEMGRPCRIHVQVRKEAGVLTHGGIGGQAVIVGEGELHLG
jgi:trans-2,3-dihydro-3-hydroxyanthranilate isomerase